MLKTYISNVLCAWSTNPYYSEREQVVLLLFYLFPLLFFWPLFRVCLMPEAYYPSAVFAGLSFAVPGPLVDSLLSYPVYLADCLCYPDYPDFGLVYLDFFGRLAGLDSDYPVDSYRLCYPDFGLVGCRYSADYLSTFVLPEHNYTLFRRHTDYF